MKKWLIILVIILLAFTALFALWEYIAASTTPATIDGNWCVQNGRRIVNTLGEKTWDDKDVLGEIEGTRCPCLCIKNK